MNKEKTQGLGMAVYNPSYIGGLWFKASLGKKLAVSKINWARL
jgi:hypothetical protein